MSETSSEVSHQSWFSRIGNSLKGILFGFILVGLSFVLLFWNEGRAVTTYKTLVEGEKTVISVPFDTVNPENAGKLIHVSGQIVTNEILRDPEFLVSVNALKLSRNVQMYQWEESTHKKTEKKIGGGTETKTTYSYHKNWSGHLIDSSKFKEAAGHRNPENMPYSSNEWTANYAVLGAFKISNSMIQRLGNSSPLLVEANSPIPQLNRELRLQQAGFYIGRNPDAPEIGDMKVTFSAILSPSEASIVAKQVENTFGPYQTFAGGTINMISSGIHSAEAMFQSAQASNTALTWILRIAGFILMLVGFNLILGPLSVIADLIPFIGNIIGAGTGLISFFIAGVLSLVIISIAWFVYRPFLAIALIGGAVILVLVFFSVRKKTKQPEKQN